MNKVYYLEKYNERQDRYENIMRSENFDEINKLKKMYEKHNMEVRLIEKD